MSVGESAAVSAALPEYTKDRRKCQNVPEVMAAESPAYSQLLRRQEAAGESFSLKTYRQEVRVLIY